MEITDDLHLAEIEREIALREATDEQVALFKRIEKYIAGGAMSQASIAIENLNDESLRKIALALLKNPYDKYQP